MPAALQLAEQLLFFNSPVRRETQPVFAALIPGETYGYFGTRIQTTDGQELDIQEYREYLGEVVVPHSHAKRSEFGGRSFMVGSIGRLQLFHQLLQPTALGMYRQSPLAAGDTDTIYNNFGQSVEIIDAIEQCIKLIHRIQELDRTNQELRPDIKALPKAGMTVGAVECPRGTLYHSYSFDEQGAVVAADMVTPSAQNTARIERDIYEVVESSSAVAEAELQQRLETLIRAYDPCNTCATHMVRIQHS
jgi:sulfhydrogenase subunit alpha